MGVRNLFRLKKTKKETNDTTISEIFFRLKKENKVIKDRGIRNPFKHEDIRNLLD